MTWAKALQAKGAIMANKPLIIEALEEIGPCDIEALASHMGQSQNVVSAMLVKYMRVGAVKSVDGQICLGLSGSVDAGKSRNSDTDEDEEAAPAPVNAATAGNQLTTNDTDNHPWRTYPEAAKPVNTGGAPTPATQFKPGKVPALSASARLFKALNEAGHEVNAKDLAVMAGVLPKSVSATLAAPVKQGKIILRKDGRKSFYSLPGGVAATQAITVLGVKTTISAPAVTATAERQNEQQIIPENIPDNTVTSTQKVDLHISDAPAPPAPTFRYSITVPTSAVLAQELSELDDEFIAARQRFDELKTERSRKGELLLLVQKLERYLSGGSAND